MKVDIRSVQKAESAVSTDEFPANVITQGQIILPNCERKILSPGRYCKAGHLSVVLSHGTAGRPVHQLVMLSFCRASGRRHGSAA